MRISALEFQSSFLESSGKIQTQKSSLSYVSAVPGLMNRIVTHLLVEVIVISCKLHDMFMSTSHPFNNLALRFRTVSQLVINAIARRQNGVTRIELKERIQSPAV